MPPTPRFDACAGRLPSCHCSLLAAEMQKRLQKCVCGTYLISWAVEFVLAHDDQATPVCILVDPGALSNVTPGEAAIKRQPGARPGEYHTTEIYHATHHSSLSSFRMVQGVGFFSLLTAYVCPVCLAVTANCTRCVACMTCMGHWLLHAIYAALHAACYASAVPVLCQTPQPQTCPDSI